MNILTSFVCGLLFGLGLILGGMTNPAKVIAFLDLGGAWDPSLALVMGGAIAVASGAFALAARRSRSWLGAPMQLPSARDIDPKLVGGSLLFGAGWGLAGYCPGPALVALGRAAPSALLFVCAMLVGMLAFELINRYTRAAASGVAARS